MKKSQVLSVLLLVSVGCVASSGLAVAASSKSANKHISDSHKKNKTSRKTSETKSVRKRQMSEKDIAECSQLLDKVSQTDKAIQNEMLIKATDNTKIAEHLNKNTDKQFFASDNPAAIAHLTGKATGPIQATAKASKTPAMVATSSKPVTKSTAKPVSKLPPNTQLFASDDPKAIAHLTGKITTPIINSKEDVKSTTVASHKSVNSKSSTASRPRIELFAPNTPDLEHLEGKSANLSNIDEQESVDKSVRHKTKAKSQKKHKKSIRKSAKPNTTAATGEASKESGTIKSEKTAPAVKASEKPEKPNTTAVTGEASKESSTIKSEKTAPAVKASEKPEKPNTTAVTGEASKESMATKSQETATTVKTGEKPEKPILKDLDPAPVISEKILVKKEPLKQD